MSILRIRDKDGNFIPIYSIRGEDGKSAYEQAKEGGYTGTEEEFIQMLASLGNVSAVQLTGDDSITEEHIANKNNPHGVTAAQVGALPQAYYTSADLNNEITQGGNKIIICCYFGDTLNSPHHHGLTYSSHGMVITNAYDPPFASQLCIPSGESRMFMRNNNNGNITEWLEIKKQNAYDVGALPIEGGTITGSVLGLGNGLAQLVGGPTFSSISAISQSNPNNHRILRAINPDLTDYITEKAVQFIDVKNNEYYEYNLFGEHNASHFGLSRLYVGSYVGKGIYGAGGETTIPQELPFKPKFMYVISAANIKANLFFELGVGFAITSPGSTTTHSLTCRVDGTKPYWYSNSDALSQLNANGNVYYFVALG